MHSLDVVPKPVQHAPTPGKRSEMLLKKPDFTLELPMNPTSNLEVREADTVKVAYDGQEFDLPVVEGSEGAVSYTHLTLPTKRIV